MLKYPRSRWQYVVKCVLLIKLPDFLINSLRYASVLSLEVSSTKKYFAL